MQIPVFIEPVENNGFRARSGEPFGLSSEGATPDEAVRRLRGLVAARNAAGGRVVHIDIPESENPWLRMAGMFKGDTLFAAWQKDISERRRQIDEDPDVP